MSRVCDNKSVGILVWRDNPETMERELLLIERKKPPFGFAAPAGHVDEDGEDFTAAAKRELKEEVGLDAISLGLMSEDLKTNSCRRGGTWHYWKIYLAQVDKDSEIKQSEDEVKGAGWYNHDQVEKLANRTKEYLNGKISEENWKESPGLEPVWLDWFSALGVVI